MIQRRIRGANREMLPPKKWDAERDGPCDVLHVRVTGDRRYASAWEPTPDELKVLNEGGSVVLTIFSMQPPVLLSVEPAVDEGEPA